MGKKGSRKGSKVYCRESSEERHEAALLICIPLFLLPPMPPDVFSSSSMQPGEKEFLGTRRPGNRTPYCWMREDLSSRHSAKPYEMRDWPPWPITCCQQLDPVPTPKGARQREPARPDRPGQAQGPREAERQRPVGTRRCLRAC